PQWSKCRCVLNTQTTSRGILEASKRMPHSASSSGVESIIPVSTSMRPSGCSMRWMQFGHRSPSTSTSPYRIARTSSSFTDSVCHLSRTGNHNSGMSVGQKVLRRYRRLTRATKIVASLGVVIVVLTGVALFPWEKVEQFHEALVSPALAASKGQRQLRAIAPKYEWQVGNCRERDGVDWPGHWRCDVRTIDPTCSGYVLL